MLAYFDKLLPVSSANTVYFREGAERLPAAIYEIVMRVSDIKLPEQELDLVRSERFTFEEMASNPVSLRFLQMLVWITGARRILEIGAFVGLSAIYMAKALPPGGRLVTIEKFSEFAEICRENFVRNNVADRITLLVGDAFDVIGKLPEGDPFDVVFIDGNKERYRDYFEMTERLLAPGGLIVVDDVLFHGDALNANPETEKGSGTRALLEAAAAAKGYRKLLLPFANGMMLLFKPRVSAP